MDHALTKQWAMAEQDQRISEVVKRERSRLRNFIRRRVADPSDVEDILQDVFYRLVEANRLLMPIEHVTGWLFRVARNRITDLFRKHKPENFAHALAEGEEGEDRKSTRLNSSHGYISYAVFCLKKKNIDNTVARIPNDNINC